MLDTKGFSTEADYLAALCELIDLDPSADSLEGIRLDTLGKLIQAYEATCACSCWLKPMSATGCYAQLRHH